MNYGKPHRIPIRKILLASSDNPTSMNAESTKPATSFWVVAIIALIWNGMGAAAYLGTVTMSQETLDAMPEAQRNIVTSTPAWATGAFALAVWGGLLASLLLLIRKKLATTVFIASFVGIVVQMAHALFMTNSIEVYGPGGFVMPVLVLAFGAYLIYFSRNATANGILQ
jgi:hypothetical protein